MRELLGTLLGPVSEAIYSLVAAIPMWAVRAGVFGIFTALALWVILLPPQTPDGAGEGRGFSRGDLRIFALFVLGLQMVLYIFF